MPMIMMMMMMMMMVVVVMVMVMMMMMMTDLRMEATASHEKYVSIRFSNCPSSRK